MNDLQEEIATRDTILATQTIIDNKELELIQKYNSLDVIAYHCQMILRELGQNLEDENLKDTPQRMAKYLIKNIETFLKDVV